MSCCTAESHKRSKIKKFLIPLTFRIDSERHCGASGNGDDFFQAVDPHQLVRLFDMGTEPQAAILPTAHAEHTTYIHRIYAMRLRARPESLIMKTKDQQNKLIQSMVYWCFNRLAAQTVKSGLIPSCITASLFVVQH